MRYAAVLLIGVFGLHGCGPAAAVPPTTQSFELPALKILTPLTRVVTLTDSAPLAYDGTQPVVGLVQLPAIETNQGRLGLVFWGTRTAAQPIVQVTQEQVLGGTGKFSVHVFFDRKMRPVLARDDATGYSIALDWQSPTASIVTWCDAHFSAIAHVSFAQLGPEPEVGPAASGGSCTVRNADLLRSAHPRSQPPILSSLQHIRKLITAGAYIAGLGFSIGAIFKFRNHKDHPGGQVALQNVYLAIAVLFAPELLHATAKTHYLQRSQASAVAGVGALYQPEESLPGCSGTAPPGTCPFPHPEPTP